jgi:hypothetical protein
MRNIQLATTIVICLAMVPTATAWGKIGHQMVANLAWQRLSSKAQISVKAILIRDDGSYGDDDDAGSPLASVANWADKVRFTSLYHWSTPLHYVDVQDTTINGGCPCVEPGEESACTFIYERDCVDDICAAGAIANYSTRLLHRAQPLLRGRVLQCNSDREAIEFLTHFVGDIHQPLHASRASDLGGNSFHVKFEPETTSSFLDRDGSHHKGWNLHSVWDDGIIERAMDDYFNSTRATFEDDLTKVIATAQQTGDLNLWLACADGHDKTCASSWAEESFQDALTWAYRTSDDEEVVDGSVLDELYYTTRLPVVKRKIAAAGVRLAHTLELVLSTRSDAVLAIK